MYDIPCGVCSCILYVDVLGNLLYFLSDMVNGLTQIMV